MSASWTSEPIRINDDTCVDVSADEHGVVLGQQGAAWLEDLHLEPELAIELAEALTTGAAKCLAARGNA
jgi:hypothetical protein